MIKSTMAFAVLSLAAFNAFAAQDQAKGALIFNTSEKYPITVSYQICGKNCGPAIEVTIPSKAQNNVNYILVSPTQGGPEEKTVSVSIVSATVKDQTGKVVAESKSSPVCEGGVFSTAADEMPFSSAIILSDMNSPYVVCQTGKF